MRNKPTLSLFLLTCTASPVTGGTPPHASSRKAAMGGAMVLHDINITVGDVRLMRYAPVIDSMTA
jgi:hypothetical protein